MRPLPAAALAALLIASAPATLHAQAQPGERTGPRREPPALPNFPQPAPSLLPAPSPGTPGVAPPATGGTVREVRISAQGPHGPARPPRAWQPPETPGLRLEHQPGQNLDEAWVRRQFELNGVPGPGGVSRALAVVQLVNRAFLGAGFINSGLVVAPASSAEVLDLRIVYGGLAAPAPDEPALSVDFARGDAKGLNRDYVRDRMPAATRRPLSAIALEREFRLLAEDPAIRTVNADLRPGSRPGEASLAVSVYPQDRFDLYVTAANNRAPTVGGERLAVGGSVRNALVAGDFLSAEGGITEGLEDVSVGYGLPFLSPRNTLSVRAAFNDAAIVAEPLTLLDIQAKDRSAEIGLTRRFLEEPLLPTAEPGRWSPARALSAGVLLTRRISKTYLMDEPFSFAPGSVNGRSEYTAVRLIGDYVSRNVDQVLAVSVTGTLGLDGTGTDIPGVPTPRDDFLAVLGQVNYARRLNGQGLELRARLTGQFTDSVLYSGERLSAGGENTVRGYRENLLLADKGVIASVELAYPLNLSRNRSRGGFDWGAFTVSAFADGAYLRNHKPPQPEGEIYSIGASLAWTPADAFFARLTYADALNDLSLAGNKDLQDRGVQFRVTVYPLRIWR